MRLLLLDTLYSTLLDQRDGWGIEPGTLFSWWKIIESGSCVLVDYEQKSKVGRDQTQIL